MVATVGYRSRARAALVWTALATLIFIYYFGLATQFMFEPWPVTVRGFVFNSQVHSLLQGRLDIPPQVIGEEGFLHNGKTYTYFGLWPTLLRLPLMAQLWRDWTTLSCVAAATLAALALLRASRIVTLVSPTAFARAAALALAASFVLSGPQVELLGKPTLYVEAVLWAYASACIFLCAALPLLLGDDATRYRLSVLAICAAVALLSRVSTGLGLYTACGALGLALVQRWRRDARPWPTIAARLRPPALVLLAAVVLTAGVNFARWGNPLEFAPLAKNGYYAADPARLERLARHGTFALVRIPDALSYYAAPNWFFAAPSGSPRAARIADLFDAPEGPLVGVPQTLALWLAFAACGVGAFARGHRGMVFASGALGLAIGLAVGPLVTASYHYLAFRYRAEFVPLILLFALLGLRTLQAWLRTTRSMLRAPLLALIVVGSAAQIFQAHAALHAHACTRFGPYVKARDAASRCLSGQPRATDGARAIPPTGDAPTP